MAAPIADKVILPLDTGNTGKMVRTLTRVVGANTVHEHYMILSTDREVKGSYKASSGTLTVPAAVTNGTSTGFAWLYNPVGSTIKMAIRRISWNVQFIVLAVDLLGGEFRISLNTFTGTGSGTLITPAKRESTDAAAQGNFRTASTGLSVALVASLFGTQYPTMDLVTGGAGHWDPYSTEWNPDNDRSEVILRPGEGISFWHAIAVTTANRRLFLNVAWEEFE